ncbi:Mitochondrial fusion and transport protein ugo1 [Erysiphe necator]|uniref:Putative mitochondrial fusion protein n=1 Tax=Uncinula necator TaxID=52586 RepID=A0A0B1P1U1_UNCNE|nr:Mitochondrial fusion and transport protein ugo1 [Erysiphe necator]KHJ30846.1 putative mitochondrial fusion protein [Erysiphe necator]
MTSTHDSPNPLRPYYKPPSIGHADNVRGTTTYGLGPRNSSASSYASSARNIFSDIDYNDYLSETSPSIYDSLKKQADELLYRYITVLLAQPFDVAKTILQVKYQGSDQEILPVHGTLDLPQEEDNKESYQSDDSDPEEPTYFTSSTIHSRAERIRRERQMYMSPPALPLPTPKENSIPAYQLKLKSSDSILEVLGAEWTKEGTRGIWKASNVSFIYGILTETFENWTQSFISVILNIPEPGLSSGFGIAAETPFSWMSLAVSAASAVISGIILAPLDLIRTKLILTPTSHKNRSVMSQQRVIKSYLCHKTLIVPTILHSLVTPIVLNSISLLLGSYLSIDPVLTPGICQLTQLLARFLELFLKLPLETVLRRAQMNLLKRAFNNSTENKNEQDSMLTTVRLGEYRGIIGTMWLIVREEGVTVPKSYNQKSSSKPSKGQGLAGLWRGWRVSIWGLVGVWGLRVVNGSGSSVGEF